MRFCNHLTFDIARNLLALRTFHGSHQNKHDAKRITNTLLVIKMEYLFLRSNIETYCFFFGSLITSEQVNDYEMILEYQGEIDICKIWVTSHDLLFGAMEGKVCHILSSFQLLAVCAMNPWFFGVICYLCKENRHKRSLGYSSFDIIVSRNVVAPWREGQIQVNIAD